MSKADLTCRLYTFEAVGQLLGQEAVPADEQRACLAALLRPLIAQLEAAVAPANGTAGGSKVLPEKHHSKSVRERQLIALSPACPPLR